MGASCTNKIAVWAMAGIVMLGMASCAIGKKPTRRQVKMDKPVARQRTLITVDTFAGKVSVAVNSTQPSPATQPATENKKQILATVTPLWNRAINYTTFSGKAKMHYEGRGQKLEFTAHFRINKDKVIWVNITALLGINVARAYITPDSIFLVNYLQHEAYRMLLRDAQKLLPVPADFSTLQNLITGDVIRREGTATDASDFAGTWTLRVEDGTMTQEAAFNKADSTMRSLQMLTQNNGPQGMMQYGNYENTDGRKFATSRVVNISSNNEQYYVDMNFNDVVFDKALEYPFSIPKSYKLK